MTWRAESIAGNTFCPSQKSASQFVVDKSGSQAHIGNTSPGGTCALALLFSCTPAFVDDIPRDRWSIREEVSMPFKIKDLMISDLSEGAQNIIDETCKPVSEETCKPVTEAACARTIAGCAAVSRFPGCNTCTIFTAGWPFPTVTCGACTVVTNRFPTVTCGACTVITRHFPTITCGACTFVTRGGCGACTVVSGILTDDTCSACTVVTHGGCGACTVVTNGDCTDVSCGDLTEEGERAVDQGTSSGTSFAALSALKEQLKKQLAEVEKEQAAMEESLLPQTVEQVDDLSQKLSDALEELKSLRQKLSSKPKPPEDK
jgi:hypothetical protein